MANQQNIIPMGQLHGVIVDIGGASALDDFEVIDIIDDSNPYPTFLGIDWDVEINGVINLKKQTISSERKSLCVVVPLDPTEGLCYTEPVRDYEESDDDLDKIYKIIVRYQYWVNLTVDGWIAWDHKSSCTSDSSEEIEH